MFTPTNSDQADANLSSEDSRVLAIWFRGLLIFYGSVALIGIILAGALLDTSKQVQATAGATPVGMNAVPVAARR